MTAYIGPADLIREFLRDKLVDPRARAESTNSEAFAATVSQTEFSLTPTSGSAQAIASVTVTSSDQNKWKDYWFDLQNQKIVFFNAPGSATVGVTYKQGSTSWIYSDDPQLTLSGISYPRISIKVVGGTGVRLGQYNSDVESSALIQIDFWAKDNQIFTIGGIDYEGQYLAEYLASRATEAFELNINDLHPALYNYIVTQVPMNIPRDDTKQAFHTVMSINMKSLQLGRLN